eukprot:scaffold3558_cov127-Isochrysis_galbana.AAC.4
MVAWESAGAKLSGYARRVVLMRRLHAFMRVVALHAAPLSVHTALQLAFRCAPPQPPCAPLDAAPSILNRRASSATAAPRRPFGEGSGMSLLDPKALPEVLGEAVSPGVRVVTLLNRRFGSPRQGLPVVTTACVTPPLFLCSGLQLGSAGNNAAAATIAAIASKVWQSHEKVDDAGALTARTTRTVPGPAGRRL